MFKSNLKSLEAAKSTDGGVNNKRVMLKSRDKFLLIKIDNDNH